MHIWPVQWEGGAETRSSIQIPSIPAVWPELWPHSEVKIHVTPPPNYAGHFSEIIGLIMLIFLTSARRTILNAYELNLNALEENDAHLCELDQDQASHPRLRAPT